MIEKKNIEFEIGFADSELISYFFEEKKLTILIRAWNGKILKLEFEDCIFLQVLTCLEILEIYEMKSSLKLEEALKFIYDKVPHHHPYKVYQFMDADDTSVIELGACALHISIMENIL